MNDIIVKEMSYEDIDGVVEVENMSFVTPWSKESFENELKNKLAVYVVAKDDDRVVAYGGVWLIIDEGHVTNIAVHTQYRGKEIGSLILDELIRLCKQKNMTSMTLEVRKSNEAAKNLYKKFNFEEIGIRPKYYSDNNEDAIIMWLTF
ncbi:ribosomal-protein-alanine acetyltransferase RimI [Gottschalkia acidurici 9a]|uniref:[Ribosomal protein bS18]-alanine N-acetyltransferase n=1 Tax=Gottschalkia acidurici (strain ATCC 7906 / DSM 604 / BCRC 14475 / CIP 104303 / KCTC 5404 / NCIMB 10678 / 9a) TaxID=1128398 RepID=K0AVP3_GOTA9|nr:ribosomal protein S18-alanine N-acetyltransferase [Gottschalkia acidurici]AFS77349.1 ribosomal-protein-alanine acetyltransferase RimI [Gottschalkia acidurici 9a]